jgi:hypothetical protein
MFKNCCYVEDKSAELRVTTRVGFTSKPPIKLDDW